jgi:hypothetical protein
MSVRMPSGLLGLIAEHNALVSEPFSVTVKARIW